MGHLCGNISRWCYIENHILDKVTLDCYWCPSIKNNRSKQRANMLVGKFYSMHDKRLKPAAQVCRWFSRRFRKLRNRLRFDNWRAVRFTVLEEYNHDLRSSPQDAIDLRSSLFPGQCHLSRVDETQEWEKMCMCEWNDESQDKGSYTLSSELREEATYGNKYS